jgi:hypothetical protein
MFHIFWLNLHSGVCDFNGIICVVYRMFLVTEKEAGAYGLHVRQILTHTIYISGAC